MAIWHIFHLCTIFWHTAFIMAFYLANLLAFYLAFYLAYLLHIIWHGAYLLTLVAEARSPLQDPALDLPRASGGAVKPRTDIKSNNPHLAGGEIDQNSGKIDEDWEIHPEKSWAMQVSPTISPIRVLGLAHGFGMSARCSHLKGCKNEENTYRKSRFYIFLSNYSWFRLVHENFASAKSGRAIRCHQGPELPG